MTRKKLNPMLPKPPPPEGEEHPLLPGDDEHPPPKMRQFYVTRKNGAAWEYAPTAYRPDELTTLAELQATFGGGTYLLRPHDGRRYVGPFAEYVLTGPPLPLAPLPEPAPAPAAAAPPQAMMLPPSGEPSSTAMMMMFLQMQAETNKILLTAMVNRPVDNSSTELTKTLLSAVLNRGGSADDAGKIFDKMTGAWKEGVSTGTEVQKIAAEAAAGPSAEPSALDKALESAGPVVLGKMMEKMMP